MRFYCKQIDESTATLNVYSDPIEANVGLRVTELKPKIAA